MSSQEQFPQRRNIPLDEVLTIVSGVNFLNTANDPDPNAFTRRIGDALAFLTHEDRLETFQLPRVAAEVKDHILQQHPELRELLESRPPDPPANCLPIEERAFQRNIAEWRENVRRKYGDNLADTLPLAPIDPYSDHHTSIDPAAEFEMHGGKTIRTRDELLDRVIPLVLNKTDVQAMPQGNPHREDMVTGDAINQRYGSTSAPSGPPAFDHVAYKKEATEHMTAFQAEQMRPQPPAEQA